MVRSILSCMLCSLLVIVSPDVNAQILTVVDQRTSEPLELVTILSTWPNEFATTNANGQADISAFRDAEAIHIRYLGYQSLVVGFSELKAMHFEVGLEPSDVLLDQVVVSASRWNQSERSVPGHIALIPAKQTILQNPQTAADMLLTSGEVFIQKSQQGGGSPMIRGFGTNRLLYSVDGVRMNTAIFRSGNIQNVISLDPLAIENTEVLFGPGSVIYGSDAIGGVMSFTTLRPQMALSGDQLISGHAMARYASANAEKTVHGDVNVGWRRWALLSSFSSNGYEDLRMGRHGLDDYLSRYYVQRQDNIDRVIENADPLVQRPSGYQQINMMQKIRFVPSASLEFEAALQYSTTSDYPRYDRLLRLQSNGLPRSADWHYGPQEWLMQQLSMVIHNGNTLFDQFSVRLAYQFFEESRINRDFNDPLRFTRVEQVRAWSVNADFIRTLGRRHVLSYGLEMIVDDVRSVGTDENILTAQQRTGASRYPEATWSSRAAYAQYQHHFSDVLQLQLGARYNQFHINADFSRNLPFYPLPFETTTLDNGALTGSAGLVIAPREDLTLYTTVSTGFRAPNVDDMGKIFDSTPGSVVVPNPDLRAEYAYNAEVGMSSVFGEHFKVTLACYYTWLDHALVRRDYKLNGLDSIIYEGELSQVQAIQNAAHATVYGVQAGLEWNLGRGFHLTSKFSYQDGEEELDNGSASPPRHVAPWFGITRLTLATPRLEWQLYAMYNGEVSFKNIGGEARGALYLFALDANGNPYAPAWFTINFKLEYNITDALTLTGGVENLTDKRYRPYASGISAAGRNAILAARMKF